MQLFKKYGLVLLLLVIGVVITEFWPIMGDEVYTAAEIAKLKRSAEEASALMKRFEEIQCTVWGCRKKLGKQSAS